MTVPAPNIVAGEPATPSPRWSVMLPVRNRTAYIGEAVASVLAQDPGEAVMEIWLVDNSTTAVDFFAHLPASARDRVRLFRQPVSVGMAENWNTCVSLARGELVHILHDDDWVLPGFYARMDEMARTHPDVGLLCCCAEIHGWQDRAPHPSSFWPDWGQPSQNALSMALTMENPIRAPGVVVRRSAYAAVGGYRPEVTFWTDWEMWLRVANRQGAWMSPETLVAYRHHPQNITHVVLKSEGEDLEDLLRLEPFLQAELSALPRLYVTAYVVRRARGRADHCRKHGLPAAAAYERLWRAHSTLWERLAYHLRATARRPYHFLRRRLGRG